MERKIGGWETHEACGELEDKGKTRGRTINFASLKEIKSPCASGQSTLSSSILLKTRMPQADRGLQRPCEEPMADLFLSY